MSNELLIYGFAVLGVASFAWVVGKYGLYPVVSKIYSWWTTGKTDVLALVARVEALEGEVYSKIYGVHSGTPMGITGPSS